MTRQELEAKYGEVYTTKEMQEKFEVTGFSMCICVVKDKVSGEVGSLDFEHSPRFYHSFVKH